MQEPSARRLELFRLLGPLPAGPDSPGETLRGRVDQPCCVVEDLLLDLNGEEPVPADFLRSRPDVDAGRIAALGMSMGSTMSWWVAALDEEVAACIDICCMTEFETFRQKGLLDPLTPAEGLDIVDAELHRAYARAGNEAGWRLVRSNTGHVETEAMRGEVIAFLRQTIIDGGSR